MCKTQCFLVIIALTLNVANSWDIAITHENQIEFYTNDGNKTNSEGNRFTELTALAYDAARNILLFVDKQNDNASIFSFNIATKEILPLVKKKPNDDIQGLAYDPVKGKLFWTDYKEKSIYWISLTKGAKNDAYGNLLIKMDNEIPRAIIVDSCRGYIYWTNINITKASIERSRYDGTERTTIVSNIHMPIALALDQQTERLYWVDDKQGPDYTIERSDLNGNGRQTVLSGSDHRPNAITISKDYLYWIDWAFLTVWRFPKNSKSKDIPVEILNFKSSNVLPFGIAANYGIAEQTKNKPACKNLAELANNETTVKESFPTIPVNYGIFCLHGEKIENKQECKCLPGFIGERCDTSLCQNYCLQGDCSLINGEPACSCQSGFAGKRCEYNLCQNYCLNDGKCNIDAEKHEPKCSCHDGYEGERCEQALESEPKTDVTDNKCNCTDETSRITTNDMKSESIYVEDCSGWDAVRDPIMMVLGILCGTLCIVCAVLITKILHLRRRPRIKKRIIVNKNVTPLTARPDQCEITIENCCNMNICETPCFEPRSTIRPTLLDKKLGKEEKRNLIDNMEHDEY